MFGEINAHLASLGHQLKTGTIVDASTIEVPPSTKNRTRSRDPEMHQAKKGNQWRIGMKAHIGVDSESGLAHSMATTAASCRSGGDAAYACIGKRLETRGCGVDWQVAMRPGLRRHSEPVGVLAALERRKASIRAKVVHPFLYAYGCIGK